MANDVDHPFHDLHDTTIGLQDNCKRFAPLLARAGSRFDRETDVSFQARINRPDDCHDVAVDPLFDILSETIKPRIDACPHVFRTLALFVRLTQRLRI